MTPRTNLQRRPQHRALSSQPYQSLNSLPVEILPVGKPLQTKSTLTTNNSQNHSSLSLSLPLSTHNLAVRLCYATRRELSATPRAIYWSHVSQIRANIQTPSICQSGTPSPPPRRSMLITQKQLHSVELAHEIGYYICE
ncbi:hypothetical protein KC19_8G171000 [Ceratodon purpureus]|uniref:Uncharacterized protein n=1 Tax=Ceratodon purpureus TaxID=3225 RepID=A0A8T0H200_CERPU|nr:hypothetical protein KC19_8G171000 [Ceratodon purpureus]